MLLLSQNNDNLVDCTKAVQNKPNDKNWTEKSFLKQMALCRKEDFSIILCACQAPLSWNSPGKNTGVGCHALLQEIFPIQGSNISLLSLLNWQVGSLPLVPPREPFPWTGQWIHLLLFDHIPCILLSTLRRNSVQFSSVQSLSRVRLSATPWIAARQASCPSPTLGVHQTHVHRVGDAIQPSHPLSSPFSSCPQSLPASESFPMSQLFACGDFPSKEIIPSKEHPGLISFRMDWLDLLAVQGTLKSLLQHHSSKAWILRRSAFFTVQLSHPYMTTGKTIALTRWTFVGKVMSLLLNMLLGIYPDKTVIWKDTCTPMF